MNESFDATADFFPIPDKIVFEALAVPEHRPVWVADLLFFRPNRSIKYSADGHLLIQNEDIDWGDMALRALANAGYLSLFSVSVILNFILFLVSLAKSRRADHKKIQCLLANLGFCNVLLSLGMLIYCFLIDVYYDVDSFNTLLNLNSDHAHFRIWPLAKQLVHTEMVDNMHLAQSFILLMVAVDRYLALFDGYSPYVKPSLVLWLTSLLPYFLALFIFDLQLLRTLFGLNIAIVIRLVAFTTTVPLSLVFSVCAVIRLTQHPPRSRRKKDDLSCSVTLLCILFFGLFEKFGIFLELLHRNFNFEIVMGSAEGDRVLSTVLWYIFETSHYFLLSSPFYMPLLLLIFVGFYQTRLKAAVRRLYRCVCCKPRERVDYNTETMRSIIAEQARQRQMKAFGY